MEQLMTGNHQCYKKVMQQRMPLAPLKMPVTLVLEEEVVEVQKPSVNLEDILKPEEEMEIIPVKKRKTKKQREKTLKVNPPGKKGTRKRLPDSVEIINEE